MAQRYTGLKIKGRMKIYIGLFCSHACAESKPATNQHDVHAVLFMATTGHLKQGTIQVGDTHSVHDAI
jgi:hypothetical protein